jgi:hypothetical protein
MLAHQRERRQQHNYPEIKHDSGKTQSLLSDNLKWTHPLRFFNLNHAVTWCRILFQNTGSTYFEYRRPGDKLTHGFLSYLSKINTRSPNSAPAPVDVSVWRSWSARLELRDMGTDRTRGEEIRVIMENREAKERDIFSTNRWRKS